jgi:threonine dehydratase/serine racemase
MTSYAANLAAIRAAAARIEGAIHRTPVMTSAALDSLCGRSLFFKCENLQKVGAFKMRGALNAVLLLPEAQARLGVVTHSSGNFAQALALSAKVRGIPATIVMPRNSSEVKRRAVAGYGAVIRLCEPVLSDRERTAAAVQAQTGATFVHPYDDPDVIAGQGTVGLELVEQVSDLDAVVVPIGGGGLISGIALALRELAPEVQVIAAEPAGADDAARSKEAGRLIPQTEPNTVADGLLTSLGEYTWPVVRDIVTEVVRVEDVDTVRVMRQIWERMKLVIEPSAAVAAAGAMQHDALAGARVGVILSGGNVDLTKLPWA